MRIRWRGLELPNQVQLDKEVSTETYGRIVISPFERGFGITVGNSLRRILLSALEGSAVTSIKIANAPHEFTSLPGVLEDVTDIVLNVKSLAVRLDVDEPRAITVSASKAGPLTAAQIQSDPAVIIINQNLLLATLTANVDFSMEMVIEKGRGYVPANLEKRKEQNQIIGLIPIDAIFSPVRRVRYKTEETRVGQLINYDRLIMEIWTNGAITPELALVEAAKILRKHLGPFVQYFEIGKELAHAESAPAAAPAVPQVVDQEQEKKLNLTISELELSVRASNCLEGAKVETVRDLIQMSESQLLSLRSFGKTSLREVKRKLAELGLELRSVSSTSSIKKEL